MRRHQEALQNLTAANLYLTQMQIQVPALHLEGCLAQPALPLPQILRHTASIEHKARL